MLGRPAQRRRLVRPDQLIAARHRELQLRALIARRVAVLAQAVELAGNRPTHARHATAVRTRNLRRHGNSGVVEVIVREPRTVVTRQAVRLAHEQTESGFLVLRERALGRMGAVRQLDGDVSVEAGWRMLDATLEGGDRLADVRIDARDILLPHRRNAFPRGTPGGVRDRTRAVRDSIERRQRPEHTLVRSAVTRGDDVCVLRTVAPVLDVALEWAERLGPLAVGAAVPRSEEHTSELQSHSDLVCRLLLEKKKKTAISLACSFNSKHDKES